MCVYNNQRYVADDIIDEVDHKLKINIESFYHKDINFIEGVKIHGYNIDKYLKYNISVTDYLVLKKLYSDKTIHTFKNFKRILRTKCCTEWSKMDRHGTFERENAYKLSFNDN